MKLPQIKITWLEIFFAALIILALIFRFNRFDQTYEWGADNVRDFLVAKHIVVHQDFKWVAPWAFGSNNQMVNSVFYFYLLAIFYFISFGNVFAYQLLFAIFFFLSIFIFSFLLAKIFFREKLFQYLTPLFFTFLPIMNLYGRGAFQPHFVLPFFIASVYFLFKSHQKKSSKNLSLAVLFYSFSLHLHFSMLVILPWIIGMTFYLQLYLYKNALKLPRWQGLLSSQFNWPSLILLLNFCFLFLNQLIIKGVVAGSFGLESFFTKTFLLNSKYYFYNLRDNFNVFGDSLFGATAAEPILFLLYLSILIVFIVFIWKKENFYSASLFLAILCLPFVFLITYFNGNLPYPSYYFTPFYILLPTFLVSVLANDGKRLSTIIFSILFSCVLFLSYQQFVVTISISNQAEVAKYELVAAAISQDARESLSNQDDFFIFTIDDQLDWSSPKYWFYLEENLGQKLVETTSYRYNVISAQPTSQNIYLICDNPRVAWDLGQEDWCLERLGLGAALLAQKQIFTDEENQTSIYHLTLRRAIDRYHVYSLFYRPSLISNP